MNGGKLLSSIIGQSKECISGALCSDAAERSVQCHWRLLAFDGSKTNPSRDARQWLGRGRETSGRRGERLASVICFSSNRKGSHGGGDRSRDARRADRDGEGRRGGSEREMKKRGQLGQNQFSYRFIEIILKYACRIYLNSYLMKDGRRRACRICSTADDVLSTSHQITI